MNGRVLAVYSERTVAAMHLPPPLQALLPRFEAFLRLNVDKEVHKDAMVIRRAGEAVGTGAPPGREAVQRLLDATKVVDRGFFERIGRPSAAGTIAYEEIAPLRAQRIERMLAAAYRILAAWEDAGTLRAALRMSYPSPGLEALLRDLLRLYALETRAVSCSMRVPSLLVPLRERVAGQLFRTMENVAAGLASELARAVASGPAAARRAPRPTG
jgi:hypothetical protein